ncbi:MAG: hypothetical protein AAFO76_14260, partial [Cyanobacteria bacterium J06607_15]
MAFTSKITSSLKPFSEHQVSDTSIPVSLGTTLPALTQINAQGSSSNFSSSNQNQTTVKEDMQLLTIDTKNNCYV